MELISISLNLFLKHFHDIYLSVARFKKKKAVKKFCVEKKKLDYFHCIILMRKDRLLTKR